MKQEGFDFDPQNVPMKKNIPHQQGDELGEAQWRAPYRLIRGYLNQAQQQALLSEAASYQMTKPSLTLYGKSHLIPRSQIWFGDKGCDYFYSGLFIEAQPWPKYAEKLRQKLNRDFDLLSNGVLVNHYRDGNESMGWHSDDEPEIAPGSTIASITLGASRDFFIRHKVSKDKAVLTLKSGDLLLMDWPMQQQWEHALPKRKRVTQKRINYTFRTLIADFHHVKS